MIKLILANSLRLFEHVVRKKDSHSRCSLPLIHCLCLSDTAVFLSLTQTLTKGEPDIVLSYHTWIATFNFCSTAVEMNE